MLLDFYNLSLACRKYDFSFVLLSESKGIVEMVIKPNDEGWKMTIRANSYNEIFRKAIMKMKFFRQQWG